MLNENDEYYPICKDKKNYVMDNYEEMVEKSRILEEQISKYEEI